MRKKKMGRGGGARQVYTANKNLYFLLTITTCLSQIKFASTSDPWGINRSDVKNIHKKRKINRKRKGTAG